MAKAIGWFFDTPKHGFQAVLHWLICVALLAALLYGAYLLATHKYAWVAYLLVLWMAIGARRRR